MDKQEHQIIFILPVDFDNQWEYLKTLKMRPRSLWQMISVRKRFSPSAILLNQRNYIVSYKAREHSPPRQELLKQISTKDLKKQSDSKL